jgi:hypothetical protein
MFKQKDVTKDVYQNDAFTFEEFLLVHTTSKEAFINLSKKKKSFSKAELLDEIKRLVKEQIRDQMREKVSV